MAVRLRSQYTFTCALYYNLNLRCGISTIKAGFMVHKNTPMFVEKKNAGRQTHTHAAVETVLSRDSPFLVLVQGDAGQSDVSQVSSYTQKHDTSPSTPLNLV